MFRPSLARGPRPRLALRLIVAVPLTIALVGCGTTSSDDGPPDSAGPSVPTGEDLETLWTQMGKAADRPAVDFRDVGNLGLERTGPFSRSDVQILAAIAGDVIERSAAPRLSKMTPDDAFAAVYASQAETTTFDARQNAQALIPGYDWQWLAASRYPRVPTRPKIIKVSAEARTRQGTLDDGRDAPFLSVTLQAHLVQNIESDGELRPIVVRRTVRVSTFEPGAGSDYWPAVWARATPFGNDECALYSDAELVPLGDADGLREDLRALRKSLDNRTVIAEPFDIRSEEKALRQSVERSCPGLA